MRVLVFVGKALLLVILPVVFYVVSTIVITALFAVVSALSGYEYMQAFKNILEATSLIMFFVTIIAVIGYFAVNADEYN